jgi:hypothetical protein
MTRRATENKRRQPRKRLRWLEKGRKLQDDAVRTHRGFVIIRMKMASDFSGLRDSN